MARGLTQKQSDILDFIIMHKEKHGKCPTLRIIQDHFGHKYTESSAHHVRALRRKGMLKPAKSKRPRIELVEALEPCIPANYLSESIAYSEWFTERQNKVLSMMLDGCNPSDIANDLGICRQEAYKAVRVVNEKLASNGYAIALTLKRI